MNPLAQHLQESDVSFDGGDLDCGGGLLLLIRRHIDPMNEGQLLEILSTDDSVESDLPSWCRLTGNEMVSYTRQEKQRSYLVCKGPLSARKARESTRPSVASAGNGYKAHIVPVTIPSTLPQPSPAPPVEPLSVFGIGSWPRPRWMLSAVHEHLEGRIPEDEFQATADDAVQLVIQAQERAGVDLVTDGEQRRDSYASFVGGLLDNCQLIPLTDLTAMVDDPEKFEKELRALDVPAAEVRHPVNFGPLGRSKSLALHEFEFAKSIAKTPVKVALPGPYLLTRTMWLDCLTERPYETREALSRDVVRVLREELHYLLAAGCPMVQFDEPVLTEVVFTGATGQRSFMCGALSEKNAPEKELEFATQLINDVVKGLPADRIALHICRGNWTRDESACLAGDFRPLLGLLKDINVGSLFLELCTPRAGELEVLASLPEDKRIGVGVVNQKLDNIETVDEIMAKANHAINLFGRDRVLLVTDCGFATFADNPVSSAKIAEAKLTAMARARDRLRA